MEFYGLYCIYHRGGKDHMAARAEIYTTTELAIFLLSVTHNSQSDLFRDPHWLRVKREGKINVNFEDNYKKCRKKSSYQTNKVFLFPDGGQQAGGDTKGQIYKHFRVQEAEFRTKAPSLETRWYGNV